MRALEVDGIEREYFCENSLQVLKTSLKNSSFRIDFKALKVEDTSLLHLSIWSSLDCNASDRAPVRRKASLRVRRTN